MMMSKAEKEQHPIKMRNRVITYSVCRLVAIATWAIMMQQVGHAMSRHSSNFSHEYVVAVWYRCLYLGLMPSVVTLGLAWFGIGRKRLWAMWIAQAWDVVTGFVAIWLIGEYVLVCLAPSGFVLGIVGLPMMIASSIWHPIIYRNGAYVRRALAQSPADD